MRAVYIHTYVFGAGGNMPWRVYEGLYLESVSTGRKGEAWLIFVDERGGIHHIRALHLKCRDSAQYWVYANEFESLAKDVEDDWNHRQCWRQAYEDVQRIRESTRQQPVSP